MCLCVILLEFSYKGLKYCQQLAFKLLVRLLTTGTSGKRTYGTSLFKHYNVVRQMYFLLMIRCTSGLRFGGLSRSPQLHFLAEKLFLHRLSSVFECRRVFSSVVERFRVKNFECFRVFRVFSNNVKNVMGLWDNSTCKGKICSFIHCSTSIFYLHKSKLHYKWLDLRFATVILFVSNIHYRRLIS